MVLVIIVARAGYVGTLHGMWVEALRLLSACAALLVSVTVVALASGWLMTVIPLEQAIIERVSFFALAAAAWMMLRIASRWIGGRLKQHAIAGWNQVVSGLLGLGSGVLMAGLIAWALNCLPVPYLQASVMERSGSGAVMVRATQTVTRYAGSLAGARPVTSLFGGS